MIFQRTVDFNKYDFIESPLAFACSFDENYMIRVLLGLGADVDSRKDANRTPLFYAVRNNNMDIVRDLLDRKADVSFKYTTSFEEDEMTLADGIQISRKNKIDVTILMYAAYKGNREIAELLLKSGAELDARDRDGQTALTYAILEGHYDVANFLIDRGADVNVKIYQADLTPLMLASAKGDEGVVLNLLSKNARPDDRDREGRTALDWATANGNQDIVTILNSFRK